MPASVLDLLRRLDLDSLELGFDGSEPWWAKHLIRELRELRAKVGQ